MECNEGQSHGLSLARLVGGFGAVECDDVIGRHSLGQ